MRFWVDEKTGCRMSGPDCCDEWLFDLWAVGTDYDGADTVEELKRLIDSLVEMSQHARECLWGGALFGVHGSPA